MTEYSPAPAKPDYELTFDDFWRDIVCYPDGSLNLDAVMRELHDFSTVSHIASEVYMHVTGGKISKPNTLAGEITSEADAREEEALQGVRREIAAGLRGEADSLRSKRLLKAADAVLRCAEMVEAGAL